MKRRGFVHTALFGLLGVGGSLRLQPRQSGVPDLPAPTPHNDLLERLNDTIERTRVYGGEVNYFHTTRDTLVEMLDGFPVRFPNNGGYQSIIVHGVKWWGCEDMAHHEILVSDTGIEPEVYGTTVIEREGLDGLQREKNRLISERLELWRMQSPFYKS